MQFDQRPADPLVALDLRHVDHASYVQAPVMFADAPSSLHSVASGPDFVLAARPSVWLDSASTPPDEHGISTVFVDAHDPTLTELRELIVHSFGREPCRFWVSPLHRPETLTSLVTARLRTQESTFIWPDFAPCLPGLPLHVIVLPVASPAGSYFALVDARRIHPVSSSGFWIAAVSRRIRASSVSPLALAGRQVCITPVCTTVDGLRRHEDLDMASRAVVLTLHASACSGRNCVFQNRDALLTLPGFQQEVCRLQPDNTQRHLLCSTTTTTGAIPRHFSQPSAASSAPSPGDIKAVAIHVFASCGNCRPIEVVVENTAGIEEIMSTVAFQLACRVKIPPCAGWAPSARLHWLRNGDLAFFLTTGWGSMEPSHSTVWIDLGDLWPTPYSTDVPWYANRAQLLASIHHPAARFLHVAVDGVLWTGQSRFFFNGAVIQFRTRRLQLSTLPFHSIQERVNGIGALLFGCSGPDTSTWPAPVTAWHSLLEDHFWAWASPFRELYEPAHPFNDIYLVIQSGPCLHITMRTRLPPAVNVVQEAYDAEFKDMHGPRVVEDTKFIWDDSCIFVARRPDYPSSLWFILNGPAFDVVHLDCRQTLADIPAPDGHAWVAAETRGNVGIAICRPFGFVMSATACPRLGALAVTAPTPIPPPEVTNADREEFAEELYTFFGSPDPEDMSVSSTASSSSSSSSSAGSREHVGLLQLSSKVNRPPLRGIPTPCRNRCRHQQTTLNLAACLPEPAEAFSFGVERSMLQHSCETHCFTTGSCSLRPTVLVAPRFRSHWEAMAMARKDEPLDELLLFTDGSFDPVSTKAAWSVVAAARIGDKWLRVGIAAAPIDRRSGPPNAFTAELEALLHAEAFLTQHAAERILIVSDCLSALLVGAGATQTTQLDRIARACTGLQVLHSARGKVTARHKVAAHQGHFLNELADAAAKAVVFRAETGYAPGSLESFWQALDEEVFEWLWMAFCPKAASLPFLTPQGTWISPACSVRPSTEAVCSGISRPAVVPTDIHHLDFKVLQYNCLSMKGDAAQEMLARGLTHNGVALAGFQESRRKDSGIAQHQSYWIVSAPCNAAGQGGCQLWLSASLPLASSGPYACKWDRKSFMIVCAEPQLLAIMASAGPFRFAVLSAHAPTAKATEAVIQAFWERLRSTLRGMPKACIPIICIDANARYHQERGCARTAEATPRCRNAEFLRDLCFEFSLEPSWQFSVTGRPLSSWRSPNGNESLIDYVLTSREWSGCVNTLDRPDIDDLHKGYDHFPIAVQCCPAHAATALCPGKRINWTALDTTEGRQVAIDAWRSLPQISWDVDATTHVDIIHKHLHAYLADHLPPAPPRPRNPAIREETLDLVRTRRHLRRCERSARSKFCREILHICFLSWSGRRQWPSVAGHADGLSCRRWFRGILALNRIIAAALSNDRAAFFRQMLLQSKSDGPAQFAHRIRAITRQGRKFRAPQCLPVLYTAKGPVYGGEELQDVLGEHFAVAERAGPVDPAELLKHFVWRSAPDVALQAGDVPSIPALASGFAQLSPKKAPGISGLAPELFRVCPAASATAFWPVLAKSYARGCVPAHWAGGLMAVVPKPGKSAATVEGWRSILLLESCAKAFQKTVRPGLVSVAQAARASAQYGGLPKMSLSLPSFVARAHLVHLHAHASSGGLLFVDVKTAYYAVLRDLLAATPSQAADANFAEHRARQLFQNPAMRQDFAARLWEGNSLEALGASPATVRYVQAHLQETWFTTRRDTGHVYSTRTGTAPGDVLFSLVFRDFLLGVEAFLERKGLAVRLDSPAVAQCDPLVANALPAWADDSCVPFAVARADEVEGAIAAISQAVSEQMRRLCLEPNFQAGKTEAIAVFHGHGSRRVRQRLLCTQTPVIGFGQANGTAEHVRLVPQYPHLGTILRGDLCEMQNLRARSSAMWQSFLPLRRKLLTCPDLTAAEKTDLLHSRVLPRFHHQAGLWRLSTRQETLASLEPVRKIYRSAFRPITGLSSRGYSNDDIAAVLGVPTAEEIMDSERCRSLLEMTRDCGPFVWRTFAADRVWFDLALGSLDNVLRLACSTRPHGLSYHDDSLRSYLETHHSQVRQACKSFLKSCTKARMPRAKELQASPPSIKEHAIRVPDSDEDIPLEVLAARHSCPHCGLHFDTKQKLAVHVSRRHRQFSEHVRVATGTVCEVCRRQYWSLSRLQQHFKKSPQCLAIYDAADRHFGDDADDRTAGSTEGAWRPVVETFGPAPWWATLRPNMG